MNKSKEFRKKLAEEFIEVLEKEPLTWHKGWNNINTPINGSSGYKYKGINKFLLRLLSKNRGYDDPRFLTFNQIKDKGWHLVNAKGKGIPVEYWFMVSKETRKAISWKDYYNLSQEEKEEYKLRSVVSYVFNAKHIEGIPKYEIPKRDDINIIETVDKAITKMNLKVEEIEKNNEAFYSISKDIVVMPLKDTFKNQYEYISTLLHEMAHSTMHPTRLNRMNAMYDINDESYAIEELRAEIASCFMSNEFGVEMSEKSMNNHLAYVQVWISNIRDKPEILVSAIRDAESISNYIEYCAELINEKEYEKTLGETLEIDTEVEKKYDKTQIEIEK